MSVAYDHLISLISDTAPKGARILDIGCFECVFLEALKKKRPDLYIMGLDINFWPTAEPAIERGRARLKRQFGGDDWSDRIKLIDPGTSWPFAMETIDIVCSNMILEHVEDIDTHFSEVRRVLKVDGLSINAFPTKHVIWEDHCKLPFAHSANGTWFQRVYLKTIGRAIYGRTWMEEWLFKLPTRCFYRTTREIERAAHKAGLTVSWDYSSAFLWRKLHYMLGRKPQKNPSAPLLFIMRYVGAVTLTLKR